MIIRQLLPALLAIFLTACSGPDRKLLDKADSIIRENPDSAMTILNSIDRNRLKEDDLAFYALLYTQAQVESSDVRLYSDSLISIAYTKYGGDLRSDKGIRANYYLGKILFNQYFTINAETERTQDVMKHFLYVYETSKKRNDDYWSAKSALHMAALLSASYRHDAALLAQQASEYFKRAGMQKDNREAQLNDSWSIRLEGYDLLGQQKPYTNVVSASGRTQTIVNTLPRYGLLTVAYRFNTRKK